LALDRDNQGMNDLRPFEDGFGFSFLVDGHTGACPPAPYDEAKEAKAASQSFGFALALDGGFILLFGTSRVMVCEVLTFTLGVGLMRGILEECVEEWMNVGA